MRLMWTRPKGFMSWLLGEAAQVKYVKNVRIAPDSAGVFDDFTEQDIGGTYYEPLDEVMCSPCSARIFIKEEFITTEDFIKSVLKILIGKKVKSCSLVEVCKTGDVVSVPDEAGNVTIKKDKLTVEVIVDA